MVAVFVAAGLGVLVWGAIRGEGLTALAGAVASSLFWPALSQARQIREMNMTIRLLEIPLSNSKTAQEAAQTLRTAFEGRFNPKGGK